MRYGLDVAITNGPRGVPLNETFLPQVLRKQGYRTHMVGKWHLGQHAWEFTPSFRGYETYLGYLGGAQSYFSHLMPWFLPGPLQKKEKYDFRRQSSPNCGEGCSTVELNADDHYSTHLLTAEATKIIESHDMSEPMFMYLAYQAVHGPDQVPSGYVLPYASTQDRYRRTFAGMLAALDEGVGNVTKALTEKGMWNNTFLVMTADNGGPTDMCMKTGTQNKPLRGGKCSIWEGGTRGTSFISGGFIPKDVVGKPFANLMHAVDWLPTLASLAGISDSQMSNITNLPLDGINQAKTILGFSSQSVRNEVFYGFSGGSRVGAAIRNTKWKLIQGKPYNGARLPFPSFDTPNHTLGSMLYPDEEGLDDKLNERCSTADIKLFDISKGLIEENDEDDVAAEHPDVVSALTKRLAYYTAQASSGDPALSPECASKQPAGNHDGPRGRAAVTPYCTLKKESQLLV